MKQLFTFFIFICLSANSYLLLAQRVGIGTNSPHPSSKLDVSSTNSGLLFPRMTTLQRDAIPSPSEGLQIFNTDTKCMDFWNGTVWVSTCQPVPCMQSCAQILAANPGSADGVYSIDPDCAGPMAAFNCYCDMTTDGGGWTLILNYLHQGGTDPSLVELTTSLPLLGSMALGTDESGTAFWGNCSPSLLNLIPGTELRWFGESSDHGRVIHFKSNQANCLSYFRSGNGDCSGLGSNFTALAGHSANLPASSNLYNGFNGSACMTDHSFYEGCMYHFNIRRFDAGVFRWDVDDCTCNCGCGACNESFPSTHHQIWVR